MTRTKTGIFAGIGLAMVATCAALAAETIYEPFDYPAGPMNGTQTNGVGMTNGWTTATSGDGPYSVLAGPLTFTNLPTAGGACGRSTYRNSAEMNRPIAAASQSALLADGTTVWFSMLTSGRPFSTGNEHQAMVLGTDAFTNWDSAPPGMAGGEGVGVAYNGQFKFRAVVIDGGASIYSAGGLPVAGNTTYLIAGKITWDPAGSNDTLRLFNITDPAALQPANHDAFATISANLDQSQFDTLAVASKQYSILDEIRFALTFGEVMGGEPDTNAPNVTALSPTNSAVEVSPIADLAIAFDENVQAGAGSILLKRVADGSVFEAIDVAGVSVSNTIVTIDPVSSLELGTNYWVQITNGVIEDLDGNGFAGFTNSSQWRFTVSLSDDTTPPSVLALSPANGATGVAREADLGVTFSEAIQAGSGDILIRESAGDALFESIPIGAGNVVIDGSNLTINPAGLLDYSTDYYVWLTNGIVADLFANPFAGITNTTDWQFTALADTNAPAPDPMTFAVSPSAIDDTSIAMTATVATDDSGPVQYFFTNTVNGDVSGWSTSMAWTNRGLVAGVSNLYRVKARDGFLNETAWSDEAGTSIPVSTGGPVYEPFDYPAGPIDGSQGGGTGLSVPWRTTTANGGILYEMVGGALTFTNLPTAGSVRAKRPTAPGGAEMHRPLSAPTQAMLSPERGTIWFSLLVRNERYSVGNENGIFVLGTGAIDAATTGSARPTITGGEGFGVILKGAGSTIDIHAYQIDDGVASNSVGRIDNDDSVNTFMIAGKINWVPDGTNDTLHLFNILDAGDGQPADGEAFAVMAADLDQSQLDTLAIANQQVSSLDEIRVATTFEEVVGREPLRGIFLLIR